MPRRFPKPVPVVLFSLLLPFLLVWGARVDSGRPSRPPQASSAGDDALERYVPTGEEIRAAYRRSGRNRSRRSDAEAYKTRIRPHWFADGTHFWYRNELRDDRREYIRVDAVEGTRKRAFDHGRLAEALREAGLEDAEADRLRLDDLEFDLDENTLRFETDEGGWQYDLETYELTERDDGDSDAVEGLDPLPPDEVPRGSTRTGPETEVTFVNRTEGEVELFWLDSNGRRRSYGRVEPGERREQHTYAGHIWLLVDDDEEILAVFEAERRPDRAIITEREGDRPRYRRRFRRRRPDRDGESGETSPDGRWTAFVKDDNVYVRPADDADDGEDQTDDDQNNDEDAEPIQISTDGEEGNAYGRLEWAPDSKTLVAFRVEPGDRKEVHLIESSPEGGGRAKLHSRPYALPGDKYTTYELNLFSADGWEQTKPEVERIDFGRPRPRWKDDGRRFTYEKVDRGHQRFRVIEVDAHTGESRTIIDETTDTFIWTAHGPPVPITTYLDESDEIIYASERDGWRHLYLVDAEKGEIKNQITQGEWVVREIDHIDEEKRQIWFRAGGMNPQQDPYFIHYYRINFDGTGLTALTEGNGNHRVQYSPDREFLIDTWSRVDKAPVHELRRCSDGQLVCKLETADISELKESGWQPPEVFVAKGRDGGTDIWGIICKPRNFDPDKRYPVIEHIYAGPQGSFVPKSFRDSRRFSALRDLGFVVVQIDGMGTANRSKAFHDVCWKNLKDAGLPDRILWHKAAAEEYPWYDISNVGIYGTSAGGQNSTGALLFHPDFYKVGVSACGCHDNRMDKASWNEQWMGYPVGPQYAECSNIENAHRLRGDLLLIVGEMDRNVPPESTLRLADALIEAGKDFEMLVVPGAGHGMGGRYGRRRMMDFFVQHVHGVEPPNHNAPQDALAGRAVSAPAETADAGSPSSDEEPVQPEEEPEAETDLETLNSGSELRGLIGRYTDDHRSLRRSVSEDPMVRNGRLKRFYEDHLDTLAGLDFERLSHDGQVDYVLFRNHLERALRQLELEAKSDAEVAPLVPFAGTIRNLADARSELKRMDWSKVAGTLVELKEKVAETRRKLEAKSKDERPGKIVANQAASRVDGLRRTLRRWYEFYDGYDPQFGWWTAEPYEAAEASLEDYAKFLRQRFVDGRSGRGAGNGADDGSDIVGRPIGREALLSELAYEMIPYTPDELIAIAEKEYAWCEKEMKRASRELGFGEDWHAALEHVKTLHVEPGEQPYLIRDLAQEAIEYLEEHDLVTVPPLCRESWGMRMMSPERQRINPFFTGGRTISVSFPTDTMSHAEKLMSMRGNNIHFSRATVHHELIPGHHLQGFMTARYKPYRRLFGTPFWTEGWALYWEMLLYERGDFAKTPEDRIGMLFWRMHRCARIMFSLGFHLEQMTPKECIELLVEGVGHERANAVAEVRRSFEAGYDPLYQAAYMLGGLQFRALYRELVESGEMTAREFHDAILKENRIPVEMVRAILLKQPLTRDYRSRWKFYGEVSEPSTH